MGDSTETLLLKKERTNATFSADEMTVFLDGGKEKTALRHSIEEIILNDPGMKCEDISLMSSEQQHIHGVKRMIYFYSKLAKEMNWDFTDVRSQELEFLPRTVGLATSLMLHPAAFIPTVRSLGTKEQVDKWHSLSRDYFILGCYAQTELGHGTNLSNLETTATYVPASREFVLHCPKLSSIKWWPGEMGKNANHALVMAQLFSNGKPYGMHAFIVQIRNLDNHRPMPGITVGSIGPTMAVGGSDNGFLKLHRVRVPRENMLAKYAEILPDGKYIKKGNEKLMYASMVNLRVLMTKDEAVLFLQKACTIAARYSCVRRQGSLKPGTSEIPIMDYVTQQHKVLTQVAAAYAFHLTIRQVVQVYQTYLHRLEQGIVDNLSELHFITAGVKASLTEQCAEGIEILRRSCGGHGFSQASGLPMILNRAIASCTYEGENTVMYLQCARYLIKCAMKIHTGQPLKGTVQYLAESIQKNCVITEVEQFFDLGLLSNCFKHRTQSMLMEIASDLQRLVSNGHSEMDAWNISSVAAVDLAKAHVIQYIISCFIGTIRSASCSAPTKEVLSQLCALYGLHQITKTTGDFLKDGYMSGRQCSLAQKAEVKLLGMLRKNTVALVDAFDFRDEILASCLGAYDGNVYERLYEYAKNLPVNKQEVHAEIYSYLRPHLHVGRDKLKEMKKNAKL